MQITEHKLQFNICDLDKNALPVIIVAAGSSSRMGGINKQTAVICGLPVIARTLLCFERSNLISKIILVTREEDILGMQQIAEKYGISKLTDIVPGGSCRQESVLNGINMLDSADEKVLIHDGARPFCENFIIENVVNGLKDYSAVTCAVPVKDTIKVVDTNGKIVSTPNRASLVAVQTPQGVNLADYKSAISKLSDITSFTDDMSIMEAAGYSALTVMGSYKNIKITTPEDIMLAEFLIKGECEV